VHGGGGGDVGLVHEAALLLGVEAVALGRGVAPLHTPQHFLGGQEQPFLQPGGHHGRQHRRRWEATEVGAAPSTRAKWVRLSWRSSTWAMTGATKRPQ
jgi:hypothetical protein